MRIYVDGTDLLAHFEQQGDELLVDSDLDESRRSVKRWLARYADLHDCDITLVWDETPVGHVRDPRETFGRVKVVHLPFGEDAYPEIAGPANRSAAQERTFVVTEDPKLMNALQRGKAAVWSPAHFVARARRTMGKEDEQAAREPDRKFTGLSEDEVDFWVGFFEEED
jgi:predicted RNA-binding protein with PIN domain